MIAPIVGTVVTRVVPPAATSECMANGILEERAANGGRQISLVSGPDFKTQTLLQADGSWCGAKKVALDLSVGDVRSPFPTLIRLEVIAIIRWGNGTGGVHEARVDMRRGTRVSLCASSISVDVMHRDQSEAPSTSAAKVSLVYGETSEARPAITVLYDNVPAGGVIAQPIPAFARSFRPWADSNAYDVGVVYTQVGGLSNAPPVLGRTRGNAFDVVPSMPLQGNAGGLLIENGTAIAIVNPSITYDLSL